MSNKHPSKTRRSANANLASTRLTPALVHEAANLLCAHEKNRYIEHLDLEYGGCTWAAVIAAHYACESGHTNGVVRLLLDTAEQQFSRALKDAHEPKSLEDSVPEMFRRARSLLAMSQPLPMDSVDLFIAEGMIKWHADYSEAASAVLEAAVWCALDGGNSGQGNTANSLAAKAARVVVKNAFELAYFGNEEMFVRDVSSWKDVAKARAKLVSAELTRQLAAIERGARKAPAGVQKKPANDNGRRRAKGKTRAA